MGKTCNPTLCRDLHVDGWKLQVETDTETGRCYQKESYGGLEIMKEEQDQVYLGDVISSNGTHAKNIQARKNKGLGTKTQIMDILEYSFFWRYHFELAMVLRSSLLLSSLLLNSEAWVNLTEKNIRSLEHTD